MNYTQLTALVQEYLQTTETSFVANIDRFIRQAEERIFRDVIVPELRKEATGNCVASTATITLPDDFLSMISVRITNGDSEYVFLLPKQEDFLGEAYPDADTGTPVFYAIKDSTAITLAPTPNDTFAYQIKYHYDPDSIVDSATSWLGDNAETALLYGVLVEGYTYLKGETEMMGMYEGRYRDALVSLDTLGTVRLKRDDYRNEQKRRAS